MGSHDPRKRAYLVSALQSRSHVTKELLCNSQILMAQNDLSLWKALKLQLSSTKWTTFKVRSSSTISHGCSVTCTLEKLKRLTEEQGKS